MEENMHGTRKFYLDYLRIGAILAVVLMHCSGHCDDVVSTKDLQWHLCSIPQTATCWAVPVFIMISGAVMLNKEPSIKGLFTKSILRLLVAYIFWSFLYVLFFAIIPHYDRFTLDVVKNIIAGTAKGGYYHLWFMPLIIGLYVILPILQGAVQKLDEKIIYYWILICIVFGVLMPLLRNIPIFEEILGASLNIFNVGFSNPYLLYFLLGHILDRVEIPKEIRISLYALGLISLALTIMVVSIESYHIGKLYDAIRSSKMPTVMLMSVALFVAAKQCCEKGNIKHKKMVVEISSMCFGVYLCHMFFVMLLVEPILACFSPFIATFVLFVLVSGISFVLIAFIRKYMPLSRYIV